jgi:hypothetical protein
MASQIFTYRSLVFNSRDPNIYKKGRFSPVLPSASSPAGGRPAFSSGGNSEISHTLLPRKALTSRFSNPLLLQLACSPVAVVPVVELTGAGHGGLFCSEHTTESSRIEAVGWCMPLPRLVASPPLPSALPACTNGDWFVATPGYLSIPPNRSYARTYRLKFSN